MRGASRDVEQTSADLSAGGPFVVALRPGDITGLNYDSVVNRQQAPV